MKHRASTRRLGATTADSPQCDQSQQCDSTHRPMPTGRRRCLTDGGTVIDSDELRAAAAPAVFAVDETGILTGCSDTLAGRVAGEDPTGSPLSSLFSVPADSLIDRLLAVSQMLRETEASTITERDWLLQTADGSQRVAVEFTTPDSVDSTEVWLVGVVRTAPTERLERRRQPTGRPDRFRQLFEQLQDPVVEVRFSDAQPIVVSINRAFEEMFGYSVDELAVF